MQIQKHTLQIFVCVYLMFHRSGHTLSYWG